MAMSSDTLEDSWFPSKCQLFLLVLKEASKNAENLFRGKFNIFILAYSTMQLEGWGRGGAYYFLL